MKTTLDIPDPIFRQAKARAARRGISLRQLITEAVEDKLGSPSSPRVSPEPPWMRGFGALGDLKEDNREVEHRIAEAFESVDEEERA